MSSLNNIRRDMLKLMGMGLAGTLQPGSRFAAMQIQPPAPGLAGGFAFFDVRRYGATGSGKSLDTAAVNHAIEAAAAAGGGTVYFPAGAYLCFSIRLKSNITLYLDSGATIVAGESPKPGEQTGQMGGMYDAAEPNTPTFHYQDFGHGHFRNSLIWGEGLQDIAIVGSGLIDGSGLSPGFGERDPAVFEQAGVGNKAIALKNCHNVLLSNFSILKGGWFAILVTGVDNLTIDNLKIDTNRDGMDIDCCKNVTVTNCIVNAPGDDAICLKSTLALGYARPTENVTVSNCVISGCYRLGTLLDGTFKKIPPENKTKRNGRLKCGTESNGGFRNIAISNCVFDWCYGLALESVDGALCEDIVISNITMRDMVTGPLFFRLGARLRGPKETTRVGTLRRILVSNITSSNGSAEYPSILSGIPGHPLEDIKISNVYCQHQGGGTSQMAKANPPENENAYPDPPMFGAIPAQGFYLRHIRNLEMSHVEVAPMKTDARSSFYLYGVTRGDFYNVTAPGPAFVLNEVTDLRILQSRAAPDTILATANGKIL